MSIVVSESFQSLESTSFVVSSFPSLNRLENSQLTDVLLTWL